MVLKVYDKELGIYIENVGMLNVLYQGIHTTGN